MHYCESTTPSPDQTNGKPRFSLRCWRARCNKPSSDGGREVWGESELSEENRLSVSCRQVTEKVRHAEVYPHRADWCFDRKTPHTLMAVDKAAAWPPSVLTALTSFKEQHLFLSVSRGEVDLFLRRPSPRLVFPLRFPLIPAAAGIWITVPRHVRRPWASILLSTVPSESRRNRH